MGFSVRLSSTECLNKKWLHELFPVLASLLIVCSGIILSFLFHQAEENIKQSSNTNTGVASVSRPADQDWGPLAEYKPLVREYANRYGVEPALVRAIMMHESEGNARLVSRAGALGLMQCTPDKFGPGEDPFNPRTNIKKGTKYLGLMLRKFESVPLAVAAYNAGPGAVAKYGGVPPYPETQAYVPRVMATYKQYLDGT